MAISTALAAQTAAATSDAIAIDGPTSIFADDLADGEYVEVHRERVDNDYEGLRLGSGVVVLTMERPARNLEWYGNVKFVKTATVATVAVGYVSS